ncbi:Transferase [Sesbania bispinosa]|nr:Transferase [Sesbania bispinosa]
MSDGVGIKQFMNAWAGMARGARQPSILPVWHRELLMARDPPRITCNHREYEQVTDNTLKEGTIMVDRSFFFGPSEIAALRRLVPFIFAKRSTTFDIITACLWCCRTKALQLKQEEEVRMMCVVNSRARFNPPLPVGYYVVSDLTRARFREIDFGWGKAIYGGVAKGGAGLFPGATVLYTV